MSSSHHVGMAKVEGPERCVKEGLGAELRIDKGPMPAKAWGPCCVHRDLEDQLRLTFQLQAFLLGEIGQLIVQVHELQNDR